MRTEISPLVAGIVVIIVLAVAGLLFWKYQKPPEGARPSPEQMAAGHTIGGKRIPGLAAGGGSH